MILSFTNSWKSWKGYNLIKLYCVGGGVGVCGGVYTVQQEKEICKVMIEYMVILSWNTLYLPS